MSARRSPEPSVRPTFEDRYSTASQPFASWALAQLDLSNVTSAADVGCGDGRFALPLARALHDGASEADEAPVVHAVDVRERPLRALNAAASSEQLPIRTVVGGASDAALFAKDSLDLVMLNFLLHLLPQPDARACLDHVRTWLRPGGSLFVAGYGSRHLAESFTWLREAATLLGKPADEAQRMVDDAMRRKSSARFTLDRAIGFLSPGFDVITYRRFDDMLVAPVDALAELTLPEIVPTLMRTVRVSQAEGTEAVLSVMREAAVGGQLRVTTELGVLIAGCASAP